VRCACLCLLQLVGSLPQTTSKKRYKVLSHTCVNVAIRRALSANYPAVLCMYALPPTDSCADIFTGEGQQFGGFNKQNIYVLFINPPRVFFHQLSRRFEGDGKALQACMHPVVMTRLSQYAKKQAPRRARSILQP